MYEYATAGCYPALSKLPHSLRTFVTQTIIMPGNVTVLPPMLYAGFPVF